ncbi:COG4223 family protein [Cohaesibacter gelatinilyticus]|uniref:Inner membrane protein n=1 Tax=Cohaesibacter gelatinilyticus TaxID=372072 RepID=A0A285PDP3_9HYPH|nr:hypothetical protein [Cohaesibacter gelatinilyticus]SNZ19839.1 hypothetical protein SAMN06265368_2934 [Cohaesibacter gelatinilyticus]
MTARKSDDKGKGTEPKADDNIKAEAETGPVIDLEAEEISELVAEEEAKSELGDEKSQEGVEAEASSDVDEAKPEDESLVASDEQVAADSDDAPEEIKQEPASEAVESTPVSPAVAPTPVEAKKGGMGGGLIAGLLGGVVALGLGYGGLQQGLISLPQDNAASAEQTAQTEQLDALKSALAELQGKVSEQGSAPEVDVSGLEGRLSEAEGKLAELSSQFANLATSEAPGTDVGNGAPVVADNQKSGDTVGNGQSVSENTNVAAVDLTPLQDRLGALATDLTALASRVDGFAALSDQIAAAEGKLADLEKQASEFAGSVDTRLTEAKDTVLASADRRIDNVVTDLTNMRNSMGEEAKALGERLTSLEDNNLSEKMQSSARTIALAGLNNAVASGQSFAAALSTFAEVAADNEAVKTLQSYAEAGAPTAQALAGEFRTLSGKLLKAAEEAGATSLVDKIMLNAQNLVRIRPIGEREGESLTDKLARIEVRVSEGRLGEISTEWDSLPDAAKEAGKSWYEGVQARLAVDGSMDQIRAEFSKDAAQ